MSETQVLIKSGENVLEGLLEMGEAASTAAVLCHPHPLYGGSMDAPVMLTLQRVLRQWGWSTLRFNFRGVGRSSGEYADGKGETEDVRSVAAYLVEHGVRHLHVAGYSFGAWVSLQAPGPTLQPASMVLISPPVDFLPFDALALPAVPCLITVGDRDDFCNPTSLRSWLAKQPSAAASTEVEVLADCDHFYRRHEAALSGKVFEFLQRHFKRDAA